MKNNIPNDSVTVNFNLTLIIIIMDKISQNISSASLFHFTSKLEYLKQILEHGFQARYCYEKLPGIKLAYMTKMLCFCDIPLGSIKFHLSRYKGFGIGINKTHLKNKGVTPLFYIHAKSPQVTITGTTYNIVKLTRSKTTPYLKPYLGYDPILDVNNIVISRRQIHYINEKEWRFIPDDYDLYFQKYKKDQELVNWKIRMNTGATFPYLNFDLDQVEYLFVDEKSDVSPLIAFIDNLRTRRIFDRDQIITKIITKGHVLRDF